MINVIGAGIPWGIFLSFMIGPVFFILLETSIIKGFRAALVFDLGVILGDIVFIGIAYLGSFRLIQSLKDQPALFIFGGVLMLAYGVISFIQLKKEQKLSFHLSVPMVRNQDRVEENSDYVAPPKAYVLLNAQVTYEFKIREQNVDISLEVNNLLNQSYRDYLNRFRYFSDEIGRNIALKIKVPFNIKKYEKVNESK